MREPSQLAQPRSRFAKPASRLPWADFFTHVNTVDLAGPAAYTRLASQSSVYSR